MSYSYYIEPWLAILIVSLVVVLAIIAIILGRK